MSSWKAISGGTCSIAEWGRCLKADLTLPTSFSCRSELAEEQSTRIINAARKSVPMMGAEKHATRKVQGNLFCSPKSSVRRLCPRVRMCLPWLIGGRIVHRGVSLEWV